MNTLLYKSGIYTIINITNGNQYIGSAEDFRHRWSVHKCELRANRHHSIVLQRAWNKYREEDFEFDVLLYCDPIDQILLMYEQIALDYYKPKYNCCKVAGSRRGHSPSIETRRKMSEAHKGEKSWWYGRKMKPETLAKLSKARKGLLAGFRNPNASITEKQAQQAKDLLIEGYRNVDVARQLDISIHIVNKIKTEKAWRHIK